MTRKILQKLTGTHFIVSESGIHHHQDLINLKAMGVGAVLIGESIMVQPDPGSALKNIIGSSDG